MAGQNFNKGTEKLRAAGFKRASEKLEVINLAEELLKRDVPVKNMGLEK